eukprot:scpid4215/ scgid0011/ Probable 2-oxoglutarate dehydrogenase E1 component DHKTD1, mitochondrial; Dehydrogenase E1 and transketolase domain-containing protein 1
MWRLCPRLSLLRGRNYHSGKGCYGHRQAARSSGATEAPWGETELDNRAAHANILRLATAYRDHGHRYAHINPLRSAEDVPSDRPELSTDAFRVSPTDKFPAAGIVHSAPSDSAMLDVEEMEATLQSLYCGSISVETQHMPNEAEREWFVREYESRRLTPISDERRQQLAEIMLKSQAFDQFMTKRYSTVKRYSGEGAEGMLCFVDQLVSSCAGEGIEQVVIGMPHRGRLNLMTGMLKYSPQAMFHKLAGNSLLPEGTQGEEDVLMHLYGNVDVAASNGAGSVNVTLLPNPSHLEAVNPVACGVARSREQQMSAGHYSQESDVSLSGDKVLCFLVHGDAACVAQGIVNETLGFSQVPHFSTGGNVHLIVNNQLGFTTPSDRGRSSAYASDIGKAIGTPVLHVNGDDPEAVVRACEIALAYRQVWRKDVIVDMLCYRRWGHNEMDEPMFTQPLMYENINQRTSVPDAYVEKLKENAASVDVSKLSSVGTDHFAWLDQQQSSLSDYKVDDKICCYPWKDAGLVQPQSASITSWDTGCPADFLQFVAAKSVQLPDGLDVHQRLQRAHVDARLAQVADASTSKVDWATAECMAMGSLLLQGMPVRICGQDVGRGTFSHRHAMLVDQTSDQLHIPLNHMTADQPAFLEVCNSPLSEEAVLGFEYGISIDNPRALSIWEAQFGDFFNGAQIILDTYVTSGESKWQFQSGLVLLLPTGMDGAGPDHSSCRLERFLQLSDSKEATLDGDSVNWHVAFPTTPAQYYHLLRRQMIRNFRKPLVVAAPKVLLRLPAATSPLSDMAAGTTFQQVISDQHVDASKVQRVIFCSGKHYYALAEQREKLGQWDTAIVRLELLAPFPVHAVAEAVAQFSKAKTFVWSQEEGRNQGAWSHVAARFSAQLNIKLVYCGRGESATPAVGVGKRHQREATAVITEPFTISK